jgi:hypothetical protein
MQLQVESVLHEDVKLLSKLWHALDVLIDEHENVQMPTQSSIKSIVTYVVVGEPRILKSTFVNQLKGSPTLSKDWLIGIKVDI